MPLTDEQKQEINTQLEELKQFEFEAQSANQKLKEKLITTYNELNSGTRTSGAILAGYTGFVRRSDGSLNSNTEWKGWGQMQDDFKTLSEAAALQQRAGMGVVASPPTPSDVMEDKKEKSVTLTAQAEKDFPVNLALFVQIQERRPDLLQAIEQDGKDSNKFIITFPPRPKPAPKSKEEEELAEKTATTEVAGEEKDELAREELVSGCTFEQRGNKEGVFTITQPVSISTLVNIAQLSKEMGFNALKEADLPIGILQDKDKAHGFTPQQIMSLANFKLGMAVATSDGEMKEGQGLLNHLKAQLKAEFGDNAEAKFEALNNLVSEYLPNTPEAALGIEAVQTEDDAEGLSSSGPAAAP